MSVERSFACSFTEWMSSPYNFRSVISTHSVHSLVCICIASIMFHSVCWEHLARTLVPLNRISWLSYCCILSFIHSFIYIHRSVTGTKPARYKIWMSYMTYAVSCNSIVNMSLSQWSDFVSIVHLPVRDVTYNHVFRLHHHRTTHTFGPMEQSAYVNLKVYSVYSLQPWKWMHYLSW
jgi:hypothetical protein